MSQTVVGMLAPIKTQLIVFGIAGLISLVITIILLFLAPESKKRVCKECGREYDP